MIAVPNRILKESIRSSDSINELSWFEEVLFYRLMVSCDDYGRFDGRIAMIKGTCFPLKDVTNKDITKALNKLVAVGLVGHYEVAEKPYLQLLAWERHQTIRAKKSKYPSLDDGNMIVHESTCKQMQADVPVIQSNPNTNPNPNTESNTCDSSRNKSYPYEKIIEYLNSKLETHYRYTSQSTQKLIRARMNEGYKLEDFKLVIDKKIKDWNRKPEKGEKDMRPFLRPETLFGNKFENYLNAPVADVDTKAKKTGFSNAPERDYDMSDLARKLIE